MFLLWLVFVCQLCSLPVWPQWQRPAAGTPSSPNQKHAHLWTRPNYSLHMWPPAELWPQPDLLRRVLDRRPWCDDPDLKIHTRDINLEGRVTWSDVYKFELCVTECCLDSFFGKCLEVGFIMKWNKKSDWKKRDKDNDRRTVKQTRLSICTPPTGIHRASVC